MYKDEYTRWKNFDLVDPDLDYELRDIENDDAAIKERFFNCLSFGTAGIRGILGVGTNRLNIFVVRQATQGVAEWILSKNDKNDKNIVALSYDSRIKSYEFAKEAASVFAANNILVRMYDSIMPVPALSFATRYYKASAGIMITASHNPSKYNGYKAYGPDGCQITDDDASIVYNKIQKTDILTGAKYLPFSEGVEKGLIKFVGEDCKKSFYESIEKIQVRPNVAKDANFKLVYSPLNGTGLIPVTKMLKKIGIKDIKIVKEQEYPNGYFSTCTYPNPEFKEALSLGLDLAKKENADLLLATDPDADRVGIAMKCKNNEYEIVTGNEMGILLLDYICHSRISNNKMPSNPVAVKSIVSTPLADLIAKDYGVKMISTLTGFKWIGEQIKKLELNNEESRFIFGFEESYGYLSSTYVRDKDAVSSAILICEMAYYYRSIGSSIKERLESIYEKYGRYLNTVDSFEFPGLSGMDKMKNIMDNLRKNTLNKIGDYTVDEIIDYTDTKKTNLPKANVLRYILSSKDTVIIRPSGTEPKIKVYYTTKGKDLKEAENKKNDLASSLKSIFN